MNDIMKATLLSKAIVALESNNAKELAETERVLRIQCHHAKISMLNFIAFEVLPAFHARHGLKPQSAAPQATCQYCGKDFANETGLKAHWGRKHKDRKREWSNCR